jgi:hypothetical protein
MAGHELSDALRAAEDRGHVGRLFTDAQYDALYAFLTAFGLEAKNISGIVLLAGGPLLAVHKVGKVYRDDTGHMVADTEVRTLPPLRIAS